MGRIIAGRCIALAAAALIAMLAFAPSAFASPNARVNYFIYRATDPTHHALTFNGTNTGANGYDTFAIQLTQNTKISSPVLIVGKVSYKSLCVAKNGGWPALQCNLPTTLITPGKSFTINFQTSTVYPAGSSNIWFADDKTGANEAEFDGPA